MLKLPVHGQGLRRPQVRTSRAAREPAGTPQLAPGDAETEMPAQALGRGEMTVTQNRRHGGREGESLRRQHLRSVPWKTHLGSD